MRTAAYTLKLDNATSCDGTTEGGGRGRAGASDNVPLCAGAMGMTQRFIAAGPLSDQDIMPRYRMTPPVRDRCPSMENAERCNSRYSNRSNPVDPVVKTRGLWWGCGEATTRSY